MIGKNTIKLIKSLSEKKYRLKERLFLVEGDKNVKEVLASDFIIEKLFATHSFIERTSNVEKAKQISEVAKDEISKASLLMSPQNALALCLLPEHESLPENLDSLSLFLDEIQDPGNLGTIIRICDWFGIKQLFCSPGCADLFNPKVIQATMGSFCRVKTWNTEFLPVSQIARKSGSIITGAFLEGENIFTEKLPGKTLLVMGNEGNGISADTAVLIQKKIKIPGFSQEDTKAESLNVAIATAIICSEFRRQTVYPGLLKV